MITMVLIDSTLESLTPSVNALDYPSSTFSSSVVITLFFKCQFFIFHFSKVPKVKEIICLWVLNFCFGNYLILGKCDGFGGKDKKVGEDVTY
jgi:hypothetical protein